MTTLRDKVKFECMSYCLQVDIQANSIKRKVLEAETSLDDEMRINLEQFAFVYASTEDAVFAFDGNEGRNLIRFRDTWEKRHALSAIELWRWRLTMPSEIVNLWLEDYVRDQKLFDVDPAQKPTASLTDQQREELKNPDSPLAKTASNSQVA